LESFLKIGGTQKKKCWKNFWKQCSPIDCAVGGERSNFFKIIEIATEFHSIFYIYIIYGGLQIERGT